jgi:hypothetical protein
MRKRTKSWQIGKSTKDTDIFINEGICNREERIENAILRKHLKTLERGG